MQLRSFLSASVVALLLACLAGFASAQEVYTWKDAGGVTHFSQMPPANGIHYTRMNLTNSPEVSSVPAAPAAPTRNTQDDNTATAAAGAGGTQPDTPSNRAKLCKQLGENIALLQGKQPVVTAGANGKQTVMGDNVREQQLATAHAQQAQYCAGH